jgi:hypothetical protein
MKYNKNSIMLMFFVPLPTYSITECPFPVEPHASKIKSIFIRFYCDLKSITTVVSRILQIPYTLAHLTYDAHDFL